MKLTLMVLMALLTSWSASANYCTKWTKVSGISCVFNGSSTDLWQRQCENVCHYRNYGAHCDLERFCHNDNPNQLQGSCTKWTKESGVTCYNPNTSNWEQKWSRACQTGLATTWCSDENPNR